MPTLSLAQRSGAVVEFDYSIRGTTTVDETVPDGTGGEEIIQVVVENRRLMSARIGSQIKPVRRLRDLRRRTDPQYGEDHASLYVVTLRGNGNSIQIALDESQAGQVEHTVTGAERNLIGEWPTGYSIVRRRIRHADDSAFEEEERQRRG